MRKKAAGSLRVLSKGWELTLPCPDMRGQRVSAAEVKGQGGGRGGGVKGNRKGHHRVKPVQIHGTLFMVIVSTLQQVDVSKGTETQRQQ